MSILQVLEAVMGHKALRGHVYVPQCKVVSGRGLSPEKIKLTGTLVLPVLP